MAKGATEIDIVAPLTGWVRRLADVPDPVFAQSMLGEGLAIDPLEGILRSPCDAIVVTVAGSGHAITIELANGAQLLLHIGIDTVALDGVGFSGVGVAAGDHVKSGDPLIRFDLDAVALRARSLITPIVVANSGYEIVRLASGHVNAGDLLMRIVPVGAVAKAVGAFENDDRVTGIVVVAMAHGLHARPAAQIVAALKPLAADVELRFKSRKASARSVVGMLTLGVANGDTLEIIATGADAQRAFQHISALVAGAENVVEAASAPAQIRPVAVHSSAPGPIFQGVPASPGLGLGPIFQLRLDELPVVEHRHRSASAERAVLFEARAALARNIAGDGTAGQTIAAAHRTLLDDPELVGRAEAAIDAGQSAGFAWRAATREIAALVRSTGNAVMIERIADMLDVERRLIALVSGTDATTTPNLPAGAIIVADEILPSLLLGDDVRLLAGIVTARGGPTSHAAILAAAVGVPMIVAAGTGVCDASAGQIAIIDGNSGQFDADPSMAMVDSMRVRCAAHAAARVADRAAASAPCHLADGTRIEVFANLASAADADLAIVEGAEGCGLLRTEFLFLDRDYAPTDAEQIAAYGRIAQALENRPLIVRTMDIGADKPLAYLPQPREDNPALGRRGLRLSLAEPLMFASQLRAILLAVPPGQCRIMLPMLVDRGEFRKARALLDSVKAELGIIETIPLGVMIETPAAAVLAESIAAEADFLSIGTNDLTQYTLAADRGNAAVAAMVDALHPAVLRLIALTCAGAKTHGRWVGVCGGLAADASATQILVGLGVTELSVPPAQIGALKARLRGVTLAACQEVAKAALECATAIEVRVLLADHR